MRPLIVSEFVTLDGVMEAPGGEPGHPFSGWVFEHMGPEQLQYKLQETLDAESLLIGRITYESFAEAWPARVGAFADKMNAMRKDVVSTSLKDPAWNNSHVIASDVPVRVQALKDGDGGPILVAGSRTLVQTLMDHDLVDEYRLMTFPVVLGSGFKLFPDRARKWPLKLASSQALATGVVLNIYRPC